MQLSRFIVVIVTSLCVLLALVPAETHAQDGSTSVQSTQVAAQVSRILAQGNVNDIIPVIVSLQSPVSPRNILTSPLDQQQRATAIRAIQQDFLSRHAMRVTPTARQPQLFSMMFMTMRRSDVAAFTKDTAVTGVMQDYLSNLTMNQSSVLIGSYSANLSGYDGTGTSVAVLDTGVQTNHEFLSGKVVAEACFSNAYGTDTSLCPSGTNTSLSTSNDVGSATPCVFHASCDHGTHVAGTVAGKVIDKGSYVLRGVAPGAKIIGIQVFTHFTNGNLSSWSADQYFAMEWLIANRNTPDWGVLASLNMSLGGGQYWATCDSQAITTPINSLRALGIATVIASGNDGYLDSIASPACISTAIAVGASTTNSSVGSYGVTSQDEIAPFSNAPAGDNNAVNGNGDRLLDLMAPGMFTYSSVSSTSSTTSYSYKAGTSMAAPHVAGAWAVMKQVAANASVSQVLEWLYSSGTTLSDVRPNTNPFTTLYTAQPTKIAQYANRTPISLPRIQVNAAVSTAVAFVTDTPLPSSTPTITPTATKTNTPTNTATSTPSNTATQTKTSTNTATKTNTPTNTATGTPTNTATKTNTPTNTATFTITNTATITNTPSDTATRTSTRTGTRTSTRTGTRTGTRTATRTRTPLAKPRSFNKLSPANGLTNRTVTLTLSWASSSGATSYEYCFVKSTQVCSNWKSVGRSLSVKVTGLARRTSYIWNVRAKNSSGTTLANGGVWGFTTIR